jgi:hypothetical protein
MLRPALRILVALLCLARAAHAAPTVFHDETFTDADWTLVTFGFRSGGGAMAGGSVTAAQDASGNPGPSRQVTDNVPAAPSASEYSTVFGAHFRTGLTYDPSTQGAIASLDYSEDAILVTGGGDGQATGCALRQNGQVYITGGTLVTPAKTWTHKSLSGQKSGNFVHLTAAGLDGSAHPDFTATGTPIEFGFFRGNSNGPGGGSYSIVGAIDNWRVRVNPFCSVAAECDDGDGCTNDACDAGACTETDVGCDDGDACTTDTCSGGACAHAALDCDDGVDCTRDACVAGTCEHPLDVDFVLVEAKVKTLIGLVGGAACGSEDLAKKLVHKLEAKLAKVRAKIARADHATKAAAIAKLLAKADTLLSAADGALDAAVTHGLVSGPCATTLHGFLDELRQCLAGLPRS